MLRTQHQYLSSEYQAQGHLQHQYIYTHTHIYARDSWKPGHRMFIALIVYYVHIVHLTQIIFVNVCETFGV